MIAFTLDIASMTKSKYINHKEIEQKREREIEREREREDMQM